MLNLNESNFKEEVLELKDQLVIVDFYATWCGPCTRMNPVLVAIESKNSDVKITKVNTDENPNLAMEHNISMLPTLLFFKNGKLVKTVNGMRTYDQMQLDIDMFKNPAEIAKL